ncbi:MAG: hypothetical protein JW850_05320 [Thermoflexales bacterium]|nr:hypothetical protein [Thermoflexales bacterium]
MAKAMSLDRLNKFLDEAKGKVDVVLRELQEVQLQFVSAHQEFRARHDATLNDLSARAAYNLGSFPANVQQAIQERVVVERKTLEERWRELADRLVPQAQQNADDLLARAQKATAEMRSLNPRLNEREEKLKTGRAQREAKLAQLNEEIKQRSGCLGMFIHFFKISALDRQRQKLIGALEENARALHEVRKEWAEVSLVYQTEQEDLQRQWVQANTDTARAREEMAQLGDDDKREGLALQRATFYVFDHWKTPLPAGGDELIDEINKMVQLNIQTDEYEEGLGKVAGLIALLGGIGKGLQSIDQSVAALINEQKMHSAYLKAVNVSLDDEVLRFHQRWDELRNKVKDEKKLGQNPAQFSSLFEAEVGGWLAEANIKRMFESMGHSLTTATQGWKG